MPRERSEGNLPDDVEQIRVREFTEEEKKIIEEEKSATEMSKALLKMSIRVADIILHGATVGCPGCKSAVRLSERIDFHTPSRADPDSRKYWQAKTGQKEPREKKTSSLRR